MNGHGRCITALLGILLTAGPASATNGMNMIGGNVRSSGLAGADVALEQDCTGITSNPAAFGRLAPRSVSAGISFLLPRVGLRNTAFGPNDVDSDDTIYPLPYVAYSQQAGTESPWTFGFVLYGQGGMGVDFDRVRTFAGNDDKLFTDVKFVRFSPTVSYRLSEDLSVGATAMIGYARMELDLFPDTYSPGIDGIPGTIHDFVGMEIDDLSSFGYAGRVGIHYRVNERLSLGFTYTTETALDLDGGDLTLNLGIAKVRYQAEMENFTWPREAEAGFAFRATPQLTFAADVKWIDWSSAVDEVTIKGWNPDMPVPVERPEVVFKLKWEEQWVLAAGIEYAVTPRHTVRFGYNYGASPVPDEYALPLFPATVEHHLTVGYALHLERLTVDVAFEHSLKHGQRNTNPDPRENPFGPDAEVLANPGDVLHLAVTYWF